MCTESCVNCTLATLFTLPHTTHSTRSNNTLAHIAVNVSGTLGQGIRSGGAVVPITGPGGLQTQTADRRSSASLRVSNLVFFLSFLCVFTLRNIYFSTPAS